MTVDDTFNQAPDPYRSGPGDLDDQVTQILADPAFRALTRQRARLGVIVVGVTVAVYFGYILLLAFAPALMRSRATAVITTGFPLGLGVMVVTFLLVAFYVQRSRSRFEPLIARVRAEIGQ